MGHARLSSSQTKQWMNCPGSIPATEFSGFEDQTNDYARLGTCAHALIEKCLAEGKNSADFAGRLIEIINPDADDEGVSMLRKGAKFPKDPTRKIFEVDEDMIEATQHMLDYVRSRLAELFPKLYPDADNPKITVDAVKRKVLILEGHVVPLPDRKDTGGTADVTIDAWPVLLEIVDYKNGSGVFVPVEGNAQLRSYAVGRLNEMLDLPTTVRKTICQPRHYQSPENGIMWEEETAEELMAWKEQLAIAAQKVDKATELATTAAESGADVSVEDVLGILYDQDLVSVGEDGSHCTWCPLITRCPAATGMVQAQTQADFSEEPSELEVHATNISGLLRWVPFIDQFLKKTVAEAEKLALSGQKVEGQKLVRKKTFRKLVEIYFEKPDDEDCEGRAVTEEEVADMVAERFGIDKKELYTEPSVITGPQMEKKIPKDRKSEFAKHFLFKPTGALELVSENDKRPAVEVDAGSDFDDFDE